MFKQMLPIDKMSNKQKYSFTVIPDEEGESFTPSSCDCKACTTMHATQLEWDTFTPRTHLQRGMKEVIARIAARIESESERERC